MDFSVSVSSRSSPNYSESPEKSTPGESSPEMTPEPWQLKFICVDARTGRDATWVRTIPLDREISDNDAVFLAIQRFTSVESYQLSIPDLKTKPFSKIITNIMQGLPLEGRISAAVRRYLTPVYRQIGFTIATPAVVTPAVAESKA